MQFTRSTTQKIIRILFFAGMALIVVAYAIWRSLNYAKGPIIQITEPTNGSQIEASTTIIRGRAIRANNLVLNGNSITVDQDGNFSEVIIIFPGMNKVTMSAHDQFGRSTKTTLDLFRNK